VRDARIAQVINVFSIKGYARKGTAWQVDGKINRGVEIISVKANNIMASWQ